MRNKPAATDPTAKVEVTEADGSKNYYEINTGGGDLYLTINAGRESKIKVMSGKPSPPPTPPGGGGS